MSSAGGQLSLAVDNLPRLLQGFYCVELARWCGEVVVADVCGPGGDESTAVGSGVVVDVHELRVVAAGCPRSRISSRTVLLLLPQDPQPHDGPHASPASSAVGSVARSPAPRSLLGLLGGASPRKPQREELSVSMKSRPLWCRP